MVGVSIVIPSFFCKSQLFRLLDSLKRSDYPNFEVLVVDNGSADGTLAEGRQKYKWVKWIDAGSKNIGQTGCYNLGFAQAKPQNHLLMIDADVVVEPEMISWLVARTKQDSTIGIVTPMVLYLGDKNWVNQAGAEVNLWTGKVTVGWGPRHRFLQPHPVQNSGTVMLFKREVVDKIGGFADWFLCYFDSDYCLRAKKAGYETWYEPQAVCYHDQPKEPHLWRPRVLSRAYLLGRNRVFFMRRHGHLATFILFLPLLLGFYLWETLRYRQVEKFWQLLAGTWVGFYEPLKQT